ncbi:protein-L-isoaspartate(D-aspartate) O-methyltransferase [Roseibium salinum]|uniref:Protein-L-isoaspartate O-methyltransferase n=1 Tax=Roseibium salinum TaxID=1604349 RepID=A0ABT3R0Y8_9HYPH|nr:protein-L-isoaspartate(D-aspartate) O-methyltransferase [Roseibium sp. DSM 29163]MCX2722791.1 protein-L-isoaspartate(D-aspartate) O-methyltransferase [Roseibium sp. DSM 29163]
MAGQKPGAEETQQHSALPDEAEARAALVLGLRRRGVSARNVLSAIEHVPRRLFLSARHHGLAYEDAALPIECGQIVSAPSLIAFTVQALAIEAEHTVLEIGTGSGYQAAVMAHLSHRVETLDRFATLVDLAGRRFSALKLLNVTARQVDGMYGFKQKAPYDRIVVTAAVESVPDAWVEQLKPGGVLIAPVGLPKQPQSLIRFQKTDNVMTAETLMSVRTVMLQPGLAKKL